jgi:hypothetical protein
MGRELVPLACACLWVAAKYEECVVPSAKYFCEAMQLAAASKLHKYEAIVLQVKATPHSAAAASSSAIRCA